MTSAREPREEPAKVRLDDYRILKVYGFSPSKAAEIVLDAKRGDRHALKAVEIARNFMGGTSS